VSFFSELKRRNVLRVATAYVVVAWVVVQVIVTLRELFPATPIWLGQTLIVLLALGALPLLLFTWFYELTPDGFKRDAEIGDDRSYADAMGRRLIFVTVAAVVIGVMLFAWTREADKPAVEAPATAQSIDAKSVAVLPFINMSANADNEYFSDGLTETLLHMLAQVGDLKVAARTSSFAFKGKDTDIREIGARLGVAHVLEGSVQRALDRIRITAQLVRTQDGFHVWSESYDREMTDIFAVQDEIASAVGIQLLASVLNPVEKVRRRAIDTNDIEAYDFYLRAQAEIHIASFDALQSAETHLRAALNEDPNFLDAKAKMAYLLNLQANVGMHTFAAVETTVSALLSDVLAIDPDHSQARSLQLSLQARQAQRNGDFAALPEIESELRAVIVAAPEDIDARIMLAELIGSGGDPEGALKVLKDALKIDPLNPLLHEFCAFAYTGMKDYEAARDAIRRSLEIEPEAPNPWLYLGRLALLLGDGTLAIDSFLQAQILDPSDREIPGNAAAFLYSIGLPEEAKEFHQRVETLASGSESAQNLDLLEAVALGDMEEALRRARDIIAGTPPERGTAWRNAWQILLFTSAERGTEKEDIALIELTYKDFSNLDKIEVTGRVAAMRGNAIDVLAAVKSDAELRSFRDRVSEHFQQMNLSLESWPLSSMDWKILAGDTDAAKRTALDGVFSKPVTTVPLWRIRFARPFMADFINDPEIQTAIKRWKQEEERIRSAVRDYLAHRCSSGTGQPVCTS
jgi:TolB-like protein/Tfp pilus assembly protein PilF